MTDFRAATAQGLARLLTEGDDDILAPGVQFDAMAPVESLNGRARVRDGFHDPLRAALTGLHRRDEIVIGGDNRRGNGGRWVATLSHYVGTHYGPLWGVAPSGRLAFLRAGEFHRLDETGRITLSRVILDLPDLMRQAGRRPFLEGLGTEMTFPGPATHDGVCPAGKDGAATLDLVERMLGDLHAYDDTTRASPGQTGPQGAWSDRMLWYGPGGVGSNHRWQGFVSDHRDAFLRAFPDRQGGDHFCRLGDGAYAAVSGWPSMTMTHRGPYLGHPATGRALTLRVMDFYRAEAGKLAENWVLLDYVDLFAQMGHDILA